jgi:DNA-binding beta-propeller fold protein YncE
MRTTLLAALVSVALASVSVTVRAAGIELPNDADTLLLLHFNGNLNGASGETPLASTGISYQTGLVGQAAHTADPGYARYATSGNIVSTQGTVEFWIKPDWNGNDDATGHNFFYVGYGFNNGMLLSIDGANNLRFIQWGDDPDTPEVETSVERGVASSGAGWLAGNWYHVAAAWNGSTRQMAFYVNGQPVGSTSDGVYVSNFTTTYLMIGSDLGGGTPALATFDEFRISNRMRSAGEILTDYFAGLGINALAGPQGITTDSANRTIVAEADADRVTVFDAAGASLFSFGSTGSGNGRFQSPWDVAVDGSDNIYVADSGNNRIQLFDAGGTYLNQFGTPGAGAGQLSGPKGVAVDPATGKIYVADTGNQRVQRFTAAGAIDATWGAGGIVGTTGVVKRDHTGFDSPMDVAINPVNGRVYVADYGNCRLEVFDSSGIYVRTYLAVYHPNGLAFEPDGDLYIAGEDPNEGYTYYDGRLRLLKAGDELISRHYTGGLDDLERIEGGVAVRGDGAVLITDPLNGRIVKTDGAFTVPLSGLKITAQGANVTFEWKTAQPGPSSVRYGPTSQYGTVVTDSTPTTHHVVTATGLTPNTRLYYGVSFPDSFDSTERWTPADLLNTGVAPGQMQFMRIKAAGMIYLDTDSGASYVPMSAAQLQAARDRYAMISKFYWRNSGFKLWLDYTIVEVDRNITGGAFWIWDTMESDLTAAGYSAADDFDAVHAASYCFTGNFGGGGWLFGRSIGTCEWVTQSDFVPIHEINHTIDSIYYECGLSKYEFCHGIWAVPNGLGHDFSTNGQILRNMRPVNLTALRAPYTKQMAAPDADNDGLPDSSPDGLTTPLSITEATLGSSTASADTDGDGLSDFDEARALTHHNTNLTATDSDGDGDPDGLDLNPAYRINDRIMKATPTINGSIGAGEGWTIVTNLWGYSNDSLVTDNNTYQGQVITYAAWDDNYLYLALKGPSTTTTIYLDGSADNWFMSPDNYLLTLSNSSSSYSVKVNVGVPDVFRQIDDDGQYSEFFDTDAQFTKPYQGRTIYNNPTDGLGFPGRLVTETNLTYARAGSGSNRVWELRIPWSSTTLLKGFAGKEIAVAYVVSNDRLFESDHAARLRLVDTQAPQITAIARGADGFTITFTSNAGAKYDVLYRDTMTADWKLIERITGQAGTTQYTDDGSKTDPDPAGLYRRFYKIRP